MSEPTIDQQQALAVHNVSKNMNISIKRDVHGNTSMDITITRNCMGIFAEVSSGRYEAKAAKNIEWDGSAAPCSLLYGGSGSRTTPEEGLERAKLIAKAAEIGAILDAIEQFPQRLVDSLGHVSVELADHDLKIVIRGDGGVANAFETVQNLVSILAKVTNLPTEKMLKNVNDSPASLPSGNPSENSRI